MTDDRLSLLLDTWRDWLREPDHRLGYPTRAAGIRYAHATDFDSMCETMDRTLAEAVDTAVDDLPLMERTAVYAVVIGPQVWRLREPMHTVYERARVMLKIRLNARGID